MKNLKRRMLAAAMSAVCLVSTLAGCARVAPDIDYSEPEKKYPEIADIAYTEGRYEIANKNGMYVSFDDIAVQKYTSLEGNKTVNFDALSCIIKKTEFEIVNSVDGNALYYKRLPETKGTDPYMDMNTLGRIDATKYVCQMDIKLGAGNEMGGNLIQVIYRGSTNRFWSLASFEKDGTIKVGGKSVGKISFTEFTNVAAAVDIDTRTFVFYINGKEVGTGAIGKDDISNNTFNQVRFVQTSGNALGSAYIDNIAVYEGDFPVAKIPTPDSVDHAVKETFDALSVGDYKTDKLTLDKLSADIDVRRSDDGNKFLGVKLKNSLSSIIIPSISLTKGTFSFSTELYRPDGETEISVKYGGRELVKVDKNGKVISDGKLLTRTPCYEWQTLTTMVSSEGFKVYFNGEALYSIDEDMSALSGNICIDITGTVGDSVFFDDIRVYYADVPFEFGGSTQKDFVLMDHTKYNLFKDAKSNAVFELSDQYKDGEGNPLIKVSQLSEKGDVMKVDLAKAGFDGDPAKYDGIKITFYAPEAYNYSLLCIADCGNNTVGWSYYSTYFSFDERGWCTVTMRFSDMTPSRSPILSDFYMLKFTNSGWDFGKGTNVAATESAPTSNILFYIKSIELIAK